MSEAEALFSVLRKSGDAGAVASIERLVRDAPDHDPRQCGRGDLHSESPCAQDRGAQPRRIIGYQKLSPDLLDAVVKTIGDAVMATFATPDRAVAAAIRVREAMVGLGEERHHPSLLLKMGIREEPRLVVTLNDRQDYFDQTVNIAWRVQGLAESRSILATGQVV
jgi:class 3 adenylate cyclase